MSFSYDISMSSPQDRVRFAIQDTNQSEYFFQDEEITAILNQYNNDTNRTIVNCCYTLIAMFAMQPDEHVGSYSVSYKELSSRYTRLADLYRQKSYRSLYGYFGGISKGDMLANDLNPDIVQSVFKRQMMTNKQLGGEVPRENY